MGFTEAALPVAASVSDFLENVKNICRMVCGHHLVSIRQFGSVTDGQYKPGISDIDFIVLVTDDCPLETMDKLRSELGRLETKHNIAGLRQVSPVQRVIAS